MTLSQDRKWLTQKVRMSERKNRWSMDFYARLQYRQALNYMKYKQSRAFNTVSISFQSTHNWPLSVMLILMLNISETSNILMRKRDIWKSENSIDWNSNPCLYLCSIYTLHSKISVCLEFLVDLLHFPDYAIFNESTLWEYCVPQCNTFNLTFLDTETM